MSAECEKHGCDLVGHEWGEDGLRCPQCVYEAEVKRLTWEWETAKGLLDDAERENARLRDLVARIFESLEDGTADIPDVNRAMADEIREALNPRETP